MEANGLAVFFAPEMSEPAVVRRCQALSEAGYHVHLLAFERPRFDIDVPAVDETTNLGRTTNRRYLRRAWILARALPRCLAQRASIRRASFLLARNLDMLALATLTRWLSRSRVPLLYEVLDIPTAMVGPGQLSRFLRLVERFLLMRVSVLIVSSPRYYSEYYSRIQGFDGPWRLVENTLSSEQVNTYHRPALEDTLSPPRARTAGRWTVGWFGTLRDAWSMQAIEYLAEQVGDRVCFSIRGYPFGLGIGALSRLENAPHAVTYGGKYDASRDLESMYRSIDFIWCLDLSADGSNSQWLLPNRLYEAAYFGVPILATRGTATGDRVEELGLGWTFPSRSLAEVERFFLNVPVRAYEEVVERVLSLPSELFAGSQQSFDFFRNLSTVQRL